MVRSRRPLTSSVLVYAASLSFHFILRSLPHSTAFVAMGGFRPYQAVVKGLLQLNLSLGGCLRGCL